MDDILVHYLQEIEKKIDDLANHHLEIEKRIARLESAYKWFWLFVPLIITLHFI